MDRRFILFLTISFAILITSQALNRWLYPPKDPPPVKKIAKNGKNDPAKGQPAKGAEKNGPGDNPALPANPAVDDDPARAEAKPRDIVPAAWYSLGGMDEKHRLHVTLTNRGAAIERVEIPSMVNLEDHLAFGMTKAGPNGEKFFWNRAAYVGTITPTPAQPAGVTVNTVSAGTPAARAGLQVGDVIRTVKTDSLEFAIRGVVDWNHALQQIRPETVITLEILRKNMAGEPTPQTVLVNSVWSPVQVIRPEWKNHPLTVVEAGKHDPYSLNMRLAELDGQQLEEPIAEAVDNSLPPKNFKLELAGAELSQVYWQGRQVNENEVEFTTELPASRIRAIKRYRLTPAEPGKPAGYLLRVEVAFENLDNAPHVLAYQLLGPNSLTIEGWWYAFKNRISTDMWQGIGLRDMAWSFENSAARLVGSLDIVNKKALNVWKSEDEAALVYAGCDCQYFAAVLIPRRAGAAPWLARIEPALVGDVPIPDEKKLANVTALLTSNQLKLPPGQTVTHAYDLFVGPKKSELLAQVQSDPVAADAEPTSLSGLFYLGWMIFAIPASLMLWILHFFHTLIPNYGVNIVMLTILVRSCMFPLSKKQALSAQKMQEIQPEMNRLKEKYKDNREEQGKKLQELFRKHNYNPFGGCLLAFVQLPIFMGLYRALMIDPELRGAPLFGESIYWCSNLSAPDMLWNWEPYLPLFLSSPHGYLGPFLNILPLITVSLFVIQQKAILPPPTDEQSAMQQKMMKYMTILMGFLFYNVPSGLCLYFIASSCWSMVERKVIKNMTGYHPGQAAPTSEKKMAETATPGKNGQANGTTNGALGGQRKDKKKKQRDNR
ncbi:MAG: YidC/Oxa1 family insertase periplasmic-domain containing protein [Pirellulales bacterium]|nr:YidC/Oxa1 family insertase periplasmic-domain containing protein [Pirellulales bacterium]